MNRQDTVLSMPFAKLYALLVQKAMKKDRTREEVDTVTGWLTGYTPRRTKKGGRISFILWRFFPAGPLSESTPGRNSRCDLRGTTRNHRRPIMAYGALSG